MNRQVSHVFIYQGCRLLFQLRDNKPNISHPNHWGLFGGTIDVGETPDKAIKREIEEELCWKPPEPKYLLTWEETERACTTYIFGVPLTVRTDELILTEGQAFGLFRFEELTQLLLVPKFFQMLPLVVEAIASPELTAAWEECQSKKG